MLSKIHYFMYTALLLAVFGCSFGFLRNREIRKSEHISNFAVHNDHIYFGAGYHLYRLSFLAPFVETIFTTDHILVEQPIIADGVAYFGGSSYVDQKGNYGENQGFFAVDLQSRKVQWKFPLGVGGYGTYGTFPVLAGERILVCARQHLHCLDRGSGRELWKLDNWFGRDSDGVKIPYVHENHVYFKVSEEYFTKSYDIDGHWSKVALDNGKRVTVIPIAENPGTNQDMSGEGIGRLVDGVVYGALRYDNFPLSRFGAFDLGSHKKLWEVRGSSLRTKPAVNDAFVFTVVENAVHAFDRKTGRIVWSEPLGEIVETTVDRSRNRDKWDYEYHWSRRLAATNEVVIVQGSTGIVARKAGNGTLLWLVRTEPDENYTDPLIFQQIVIVSSVKDCSIFALDLKSGKELWRTKIPDCALYYIFDD